MSWLKSGLNFVGGLFGRKSSGISMPTNSAIMTNPLSFASNGYPSGITGGSGTTNDPFNIASVSVSPPNTKKTSGSTSNVFDKVISGVGAATGLIGALKGNPVSVNYGNNSSDGSRSDSNGYSGTTAADVLGEPTIKHGLDKNTKIFLGVAGGAALLYFMFK